MTKKGSGKTKEETEKEERKKTKNETENNPGEIDKEKITKRGRK